MVSKLEIFEELKKSTSRASDKSKMAYSTSLRNIFNKLKIDNLKTADKKLENISKVKEILPTKLSTQKNYLVAVRVWLLRDHKKNEKLLESYWNILDDIIKQHKDETNLNRKTETEKTNWINWDKLRKTVLTYYAREYKRLNLSTKENFTKRDMEILKKFVIAYLYLDFDDFKNYEKKIFPRRNEYVDMKAISSKDFNKLTDKQKLEFNWLITKSPRNRLLVFNKYKTFKKYGTITIKITGALNSILTTYLKHHKEEYFITQKNNKKFTTNNFSKYLIKVFEPSGKKITVNLLRHIVLSKIYDGIPRNEILESIASRMGHNILRALDYRKVDSKDNVEKIQEEVEENPTDDIETD